MNVVISSPRGSTHACVEVEEWLSGRRHWFAKSAYALAHTMGSNPISSVSMPFQNYICSPKSFGERKALQKKGESLSIWTSTQKKDVVFLSGNSFPSKNVIKKTSFF